MMIKKIKHKLKNILGRVFRLVAFPIFEENNDILLRKTSRLLSIAQLHQSTFLKFRGCNRGKSIVIVGAGPSVNRFKPLEDCVYIGLNRACLLKDVLFTYLFSIDKIGIEHIYPQFEEYNCIKFIGDQNLGSKWQIPESEIAKMKGTVYRYKTDAGLFRESHFALDIDSEPLGNFNTVSLQAMQFALYTNPSKIYLVGIDCSSVGHFSSNGKEEEVLNMHIAERGENRDKNASDSVYYWQMLKEFAELYYSGTEIISVNPVGLRGLFNDMDQE